MSLWDFKEVNAKVGHHANMTSILIEREQLRVLLTNSNGQANAMSDHDEKQKLTYIDDKPFATTRN